MLEQCHALAVDLAAKARPATNATLSVIWGCAGHQERLLEADRGYRALRDEAGATTAPV
jgi:hypothetical protein